MLVAVANYFNAEWIDRLSRQLAKDAMVLTAESTADAVDIARRLPVSVLIVHMDPLTTERVVGYGQIVEQAPGATTVCVAPQVVREQIEIEELFVPDFWLDPEGGAKAMDETLNAAAQRARLASRSSGGRIGTSDTRSVGDAVGRPTPEREVFHRLMSALAGRFDMDRLLSGYVEAASELTRCVSHCLLWRERDTDYLSVRISHGLHPEVAAKGRLVPTDSLAGWYDHNSRILSRNELGDWADAALAAELARELDVFRGQVVVPLNVRGQLAGLLILGEKAIGEPYSGAELETLFILAGYVAMQVENIQLLAHGKAGDTYLERSVYGMDSGLIALGQDERIALCNAYAAKALEVNREELEGADLRSLPSPLGDRLYAAFVSPEAEVTGEEMRLASSGRHVRISTTQLLDDEGAPMGSVMALEDITDAMARAAERNREERLEVLTQVIGRIAHDIRTPLTAIKTYAQLMSQSQATTELGAFWRSTVEPELERLDRLVSKLVQMVQQPDPNFQLVDLERLVQQVIAQSVSPGNDRRPLPDLQVVPPVPRIVADPASTREALSYLLRYLQSFDDLPVTVSVAQEQGAMGHNACVTMRKAANGNQISTDEIFDPLSALQRPDGDLGPAISRQIVDKQGGTVAARSENGDIEFRVAFPVIATDSPASSEGEEDGKP